MKLTLPDIAAAIAVAMLWGMGLVVAKAGMNHFPPIFLMALRFLLTVCCLVWFYRPPLGILRDIFWTAMVCATLQYILIFSGINGIDVSTGALLVQLEVPFTILLSWLIFRDRMTPRQIGGIVLAFIGIISIIGEPRLEGSLFHIGLVVSGSAVWAAGQIMVKRLGTKTNGEQMKLSGLALTTWIAVMATPQLFIASFILESGHLTVIRSAPLAAWGGVLYLGLMMTVLAYGMWYRLLRRYPISRVMPFMLLLPLSSVAGGIFFLGEVLTTQIIIGGVLVLAGITIITIAPARAETR